MAITVQRVSHLFGEGTSYTALTTAGIWSRMIQGTRGKGWTWRVSGPQAELVALGAYEGQGGVWYLNLGNGADPIEVHPGVTRAEPAAEGRAMMGRIEKQTHRRTHTKWVDGVKHRWQSSRTTYFVKFDSGRIYPCDNKAQAEQLVNDEAAVIALMQMK